MSKAKYIYDQHFDDEYKCKDCGHTHHEKQVIPHIQDVPISKCKKCGSEKVKVKSTRTFVPKGKRS